MEDLLTTELMIEDVVVGEVGDGGMRFSLDTASTRTRCRTRNRGCRAALDVE